MGFFFALQLIATPATLRGFTARNGKLYFLADDVAKLVRSRHKRALAHRLGTCRLRQVTGSRHPCLRPSAWVIEYQALVHFLGCVTLDADNTLPEHGKRSLLRFLKRGSVSELVRKRDRPYHLHYDRACRDLIYLREDPSSGVTFSSWMLGQRALRFIGDSHNGGSSKASGSKASGRGQASGSGDRSQDVERKKAGDGRQDGERKKTLTPPPSP